VSYRAHGEKKNSDENNTVRRYRADSDNYPKTVTFTETYDL